MIHPHNLKPSSDSVLYEHRAKHPDDFKKLAMEVENFYISK
ncbi:MAG: hypothetical protein ACI4RJ_02395 [Alphaproteobacteria bacterium]